MKILAIETSCDETAMAVVKAEGGLVRPHFTILKNLVTSQIKIHQPFGGVVPTLAKREHQKNLPKIWQRIANRKLQIDIIAVTIGPGLEPALWQGIEFAKNLAKKLNKPIIGANHLEGHLYGFLLAQKTVISNFSKIFPVITLLVSGGHTILLLMKSLTQWKKLGETRDDAAGEAFDKTARLLNLPYPGGPEIEKIAKQGNPSVINFPRPMIDQKNYDFSFSGLKTAVLYYLRNLKSERDLSILNHIKADVAVSFQQAVIDVLVGKTIRAAKEFKVKSVILCGGVAANRTLRRNLKQAALKSGFQFVSPPIELNTDNAAMMAAAAYIDKFKGKKLRLIARPNLTL